MGDDIAFALKPSLWAKDVLGFDADKIQCQILDSTSKRIIVNCHRQWGKSTIASLICLHRAIYYPESLCLIVAPALRQSQENFRKILEDLNRMEEMPELQEDTKLSLTLANKSRILSLPGGNEGRTIRGFSGPSIIVEDESARCSDTLYQALRPMLASNPNGKLILCSTPWGQRGHFYKIWTEESGWSKVKVVASENPRISPAFLAEERQSLGSWIYKQEYEGGFVAVEGQLFSEELIKSLFDSGVKPLFSSNRVSSNHKIANIIDQSAKPLFKSGAG